MYRRNRRRPCAFTLVELLVVIGIIALLIAILMPTVRAAWVAAQNAQCLSNLRQIGQATIMYRAETGRVPFFFVLRNFTWSPVPPNGTGNAVWWTAFGHGGKTTHPSITAGYVDDRDKPLNKYLYKDIYPEHWSGARAAAEARVARDAFRCPADDGTGMGRGVGAPVNYLGPSVPSPYELYGTSYMSNRGFMYDAEVVQLFRRVMSPPWTHAKVDYFNKGVSKIVTRWNASETYVAADVWFLWSLFYGVDVPGAHSKQSAHNGVFLDGHAKHVYVTKRDLTSWGPRVPGRYTPKFGDGWREVRRWDARDTYLAPWSGVDPFGVTPGERQTPGTKG